MTARAPVSPDRVACVAAADDPNLDHECWDEDEIAAAWRGARNWGKICSIWSLIQTIQTVRMSVCMGTPPVLVVEVRVAKPCTLHCGILAVVVLKPASTSPLPGDSPGRLHGSTGAADPWLGAVSLRPGTAYRHID